MIKEEKLQKKLQRESYKIICKSISEQERTAMNLTAEQIIPTINFFKEIQLNLLDDFCEDARIFNSESIFEYCSEIYDYESKTFIKKTEFKSINMSFLECLCKDVGIKILSDEKNRFYLFKWLNGRIYDDIRRKYLVR